MSTVTEITSIIQETGPRDPDDKCHTYPGKGKWALCGVGGDGKGGSVGWHTSKQCRERGHRKCVVCKELDRQLGDDNVMAA
jgi:hypothetical protein